AGGVEPIGCRRVRQAWERAVIVFVAEPGPGFLMTASGEFLRSTRVRARGTRRSGQRASHSANVHEVSCPSPSGEHSLLRGISVRDTKKRQRRARRRQRSAPRSYPTIALVGGATGGR